MKELDSVQIEQSSYSSAVIYIRKILKSELNANKGFDQLEVAKSANESSSDSEDIHEFVPVSFKVVFLLMLKCSASTTN